MAFDIARFSVFDTGKTGAGLMAMYDGSGGDGVAGRPDEGGDLLATLRGKNFFDHEAVRDKVRMAQDPQTGGGLSNGKGLICWLHGHDGIEARLLIFDAADTDQVTTVGGGGGPAWALD